jgi:hypothetical protein
MNKLLVALIAGAFASVAAAQTAPPKPTTQERAADVKAATQAGSGSSASTQKTAAEQAANTKASREVAKMSRAEKEAFAKEINRTMLNPDNPSGSVAGTAAMQKANTATSKEVAKNRPNLNTPEAQKALQKASTP